MSDERGSEMSRLIGLVLIVVGAVWLLTTGLCSAAFGIAFLEHGNTGDFGTVLLIGLPSALIGGVIYAIGRWLRPKAQ